MRRLALAVVVVAAGTFVAFQGAGPAGAVAWEAVVVAALGVVLWRRWPSEAEPVPGLFGRNAGLSRPPLAHLAALELEVTGATDPVLGGDGRLRRRLVALAEHRADVTPGSLDDVSAPPIMGEVWPTLAASGPLTATEIESIVSRIEAL